MTEGFRIPVVKHLEDADDLHQGRDASLVPGQEGEALLISESLNAELEAGEYRIAIFTVSPKKRAEETASMVKKTLSDSNPRLRIVMKTEPDLREIDQGTFILPSGYAAGDTYDGLKKAGRIFSEESFSQDGPEKNNLLYRFGDPVVQPDGTAKYPELMEYFSEPGESYRDVLVRLYRQVVILSEEMARYSGKTLPVVFTHGQPHQIFTDLAEVAALIVEEDLNVSEGELPQICWDLYQKRRKGVVPYGKTNFVSIEHLDKPELIDILRREIAYLEGLQ